MDRKPENGQSRLKLLEQQGRAEPRFIPRLSSQNSVILGYDTSFRDDPLAPVMPAIDAIKLLDQNEDSTNSNKSPLPARVNSPIDLKQSTSSCDKLTGFHQKDEQEVTPVISNEVSNHDKNNLYRDVTNGKQQESHVSDQNSECINGPDLSDSDSRILNQSSHNVSDEYEFIPKSSILDLYSNDPEVKRFLKQLTRIPVEYGYDEQDYKCNSCRRPIGMIFGQSRLCMFDGHHYCTECHLGEKSVIPGRVLCNWDFSKYPISKRNQHLLMLVSNEPIFQLRTIAPLLYDNCTDLSEVDELRRQSFFIRSYCFTCAQDSISIELTKQVWPRDHLIKHIDTYSLDDLIQVKQGTLKNTLKSVIMFGKDHILSCILCRFKGFFCELCNSSQIIYPFDTGKVQRCDACQGVYHKLCYDQNRSENPCPRCRRLNSRRNGERA